MRGGESVKEDMMGKSLMGREFFWRGKHFEEEDIFMWEIF